MSKLVCCLPYQDGHEVINYRLYVNGLPEDEDLFQQLEYVLQGLCFSVRQQLGQHTSVLSHHFASVVGVEFNYLPDHCDALMRINPVSPLDMTIDLLEESLVKFRWVG